MKLVVILMTGLFLLPLVAVAGEKEDLEQQGKYLIEKERRLQLELNFFNQEKRDFDARLKIYNDKEVAKQKAAKPEVKPEPTKPAEKK